MNPSHPYSAFSTPHNDHSTPSNHIHPDCPQPAPTDAQQQQYAPQYPDYQQDQHQNSFLPSAKNPPGYVPPSQYPMPGVVLNTIDRKTVLKKQIEHVENNLNAGWIFLYKQVIQYLLMGYGLHSIFFLGCLIYFLSSSGLGNLEEYWSVIFVVISSIWLGSHGYLLFMTLNKHCLKMAKRATILITAFGIFYFLVALGTFIHNGGKENQTLDWNQSYYQSFLKGVFLPTSLNFLGTWKLKSLLEEREALKLELENEYEKSV